MNDQSERTRIFRELETFTQPATPYTLSYTTTQICPVFGKMVYKTSFETKEQLENEIQRFEASEGITYWMAEFADGTVIENGVVIDGPEFEPYSICYVENGNVATENFGECYELDKAIEYCKNNGLYYVANVGEWGIEDSGYGAVDPYTALVELSRNKNTGKIEIVINYTEICRYSWEWGARKFLVFSDLVADCERLGVGIDPDVHGWDLRMDAFKTSLMSRAERLFQESTGGYLYSFKQTKKAPEYWQWEDTKGYAA